LTRSVGEHVAWFGVGGFLLIAAVAGWPVDRLVLDWQPARVAAEPWRAWTAAFVHLSGLHLAANLAGAALVVAFGAAARVGATGAWAWLIAWPLTHLALLMQPALEHYAGLSGVLHAGVAIVATQLQFTGTPRQRVVAALTLAVLAAKIVHEAPWAHVVIHPAGWDIPVAPLAHATGAGAGVLAALLVRVLLRVGSRLRIQAIDRHD